MKTTAAAMSLCLLTFSTLARADAPGPDWASIVIGEWRFMPSPAQARPMEIVRMALAEKPDARRLAELHLTPDELSGYRRLVELRRNDRNAPEIVRLSKQQADLDKVRLVFSRDHLRLGDASGASDLGYALTGLTDDGFSFLATTGDVSRIRFLDHDRMTMETPGTPATWWIRAGAAPVRTPAAGASGSRWRRALIGEWEVVAPGASSSPSDAARNLTAVRVIFTETKMITNLASGTHALDYRIESELPDGLVVLEDGDKAPELRRSILKFESDDRMILVVGTSRVPMTRVRPLQGAAPTGDAEMDQCNAEYFRCLDQMDANAKAAMGESLQFVKRASQASATSPEMRRSYTQACRDVLRVARAAGYCH